jgi:hypothetical protein
MSNWTLPTTASLYTTLLDELKNRDIDLARGLDPATITAYVGTPDINTTRWNSANAYWEKYNGTSWGVMAASYAINVSGTAAKWAAARTYTFSGGATGSFSTDGSIDVSIGITLATVGVGTGGTGITSYTIGDLTYASTTSALSKLAAVAAGNVLISQGTGTAPAYGKVALTTHVSGTLPVANGGTGVATLTGIVKASGTNVFAAATASDIVSLISTTPVSYAGHLTNGRASWVTGDNGSDVVGQLGWKNYGNNHTIFDASAGTTPIGGACSASTPENQWAATYPTLMGFNGTNTYGVRVDIAARSESCTGIAATADALTTANNYQMNSLGVGGASSGVAGEIKAYGNVTAYQTSDRNLKTNIRPISNALQKLNSISGNNFDWIQSYLDERGPIDAYFNRREDVGVIAQEVHAILPEAVAKRDNGTLAVNYEKLIPLLIEAIKELDLRTK